ncbi:uncharacterized protein LOC144653719 isoform X2 [Oculina patagonica]
MKAWCFLVLVLIVLSCEAGKKKKKKPSSGVNSLKDRFLRGPQKATPSPTPAPPAVKVNKDFYFRYMNFICVAGQKPAGRPGSGHETAVDTSDTSWFCHLGRTLVHLPTPAYGNGFYFPQCTWLNRCVGCCTSSNNLLACQPTGVQKKKVDYYHIRPQSGGYMPEEKSIWMEEHTGCQCQCIKTPDSCDTITQYWRPDICECECNPGYRQHEMNCPAKFHYDPRKCDCVCKTGSKECSNPNMIWSDEECGCICKNLDVKCSLRYHYRDPYTCGCV